MSEMTARERLTHALRGEPIDRLPFSPFLAYVWEHFPADVQQRGQLAFLREVGADPLWRGAPCPVSATVPELGATDLPGVVGTRQVERGDQVCVETVTPVGTLRASWVRSAAGNTAFLVEHPLKTEEDFKVQCWIEEHTQITYTPEPMREHLRGEGREGLSVGMLLPRCKTAFQTLVEHLVGTEELAYALYDFPETVEMLLHAMVENDLRAARLAVESEYEFFLTWEDSSTQNYSPTQYARYISPEIRACCTLLNAHGKGYLQHACGHVRDLLPLMIADGITAIESISPPPTGNLPLAEARAMAGSRCGIVGGIEPTAFLALSLDALVPYVEQVIAEGAGGPFVLANSDSCPPGVSVEKFKLVADLARRTRV